MRVAALLLLPGVALAAPVPKQTEMEKIQATFGKIVDPKGDSKFALDGDKLVITLPANETRSFDHEKGGIPFNPFTWKKWSNAPRVEREVSGDFTATVRVTITLDPKAKFIRDECDWTFLGGGLQVSWTERDCYYTGPLQQFKDETLERSISMESPGAFSKPGGIGSWHRKELMDATWVKLSRTGNDLVFAVSTDGKTYRDTPSVANAVTHEKLTLALSAHHSSDKPHTVTFDEFKVEKK